VRRLTRVADRYRQHPDVERVASQLERSTKTNITEPFRLHAAVDESVGTLGITVLSVASPHNRVGPRWLPIYKLGKNRGGGGADPTLGKAIASVLVAAERRLAANPQLHRLEIYAPSVANPRLARTLGTLGFEPVGGGTLAALRAGQLVLGRSEFLKLTLDLTR